VADMSRNDQGALVVNQATAVIVSAWLEHCSVVTQAGHDTGLFRIDHTELVNVVNAVQDALKDF